MVSVLREYCSKVVSRRIHTYYDVIGELRETRIVEERICFLVGDRGSDSDSVRRVYVCTRARSTHCDADGERSSSSCNHTD